MPRPTAPPTAPPTIAPLSFEDLRPELVAVAVGVETVKEGLPWVLTGGAPLWEFYRASCW